jgi:hypothetical protein
MSTLGDSNFIEDWHAPEFLRFLCLSLIGTLHKMPALSASVEIEQMTSDLPFHSRGGCEPFTGIILTNR